MNEHFMYVQEDNTPTCDIQVGVCEISNAHYWVWYTMMTAVSTHTEFSAQYVQATICHSAL